MRVWHLPTLLRGRGETSLVGLGIAVISWLLSLGLCGEFHPTAAESLNMSLAIRVPPTIPDKCPHCHSRQAHK
jgi:hypothetical protein